MCNRANRKNPLLQPLYSRPYRKRTRLRTVPPPTQPSAPVQAVIPTIEPHAGYSQASQESSFQVRLVLGRPVLQTPPRRTSTQVPESALASKTTRKRIGKLTASDHLILMTYCEQH
jgi:hypothetical protein